MIKDNNIINNSNLQNEKDSRKDNSIQKEIGGFKGMEPTKYGDWQHKGRVTDF